MNENFDYLDTNILDSMSTSCNNYLKNQFSNYLYKTSTIFESDINNFGLYALSQFTTTTEFNNYNWLENYKNSTFDIDINTIIEI